MNQQMQFDLGAARAEVGIERSAARADRKEPGWTDRAAESVRDLLRHPSFELVMLYDKFTIDEVRSGLHSLLMLDPPPDLRAWGAVTRRAVNLGYIRRLDGQFRSSASSNCSPKPLYVKGPNA